jgi:hypothetical protein
LASARNSYLPPVGDRTECYGIDIYTIKYIDLYVLPSTGLGLPTDYNYLFVTYRMNT